MATEQCSLSAVGGRRIGRGTEWTRNASIRDDASKGTHEDMGMTKHMRRMFRLSRQAIAEGRGHETMAELEALIAEQSKPENLPPWWYDDFNTTNEIIGGLKVNFKSKKRYSNRRRR